LKTRYKRNGWRSGSCHRALSWLQPPVLKKRKKERKEEGRNERKKERRKEGRRNDERKMTNASESEKQNEL
jgi:hypothetical protein